MAKVVFLDIDGVCHQVDDPRGPFRPKCMMQLKKLVHGSGAEDGRKMKMMAFVPQRQVVPRGAPVKLTLPRGTAVHQM